VSARSDPGLLGSGLLGFWKGGSAAMGAKPPLSAPAKPVNFFVFDQFSQEGAGGDGTFKKPSFWKKLGFLCAGFLRVAQEVRPQPDFATSGLRSAMGVTGAPARGAPTGSPALGLAVLRPR
jgi:hypothetical protein